MVGSIPGQNGIFMRVLDRTGALSVPVTRVDDSTDPGDLVGNAVVGMSSNGIFAVAWQRYIQASTTSQIKLVLFNRDGTPRTSPRIVAANQGPTHYPTDVALDGSGNASLVWQSAFLNNASASVWLEQFNSVGWSLGAPTQLNTSGINAREPRVAVAPSGRAVAVWGESFVGATSAVIWGRRFNDAGAPLGASFVISNQLNNNLRSDVGMTDDGRFVAVWHNLGSLGNPRVPPYLGGREYLGDGTAVSTFFRVSSGADAGAFVSMDPSGGFIAMWSGFGVAMGRRYVLDGLPSIATLGDVSR